MRRKMIGLLVVFSLGLLALGCTTTNTTTILPPEQQPPGIAVSGSGSAFGEPDIAVLSLGVEAQATGVAEARSQAAEAMNAMLDALKAGGVASEDIQTTRFSVQPRYDFTERRQILVGFTVTNMVTAKIRNIDDTGDLIDAAIEAGGDLARINNLRFTIDDPSALEDEARLEAMAEARSKAETLAQAAGVILGAPRSISESAGAVPIQFGEAEFSRLAIADSVATAIELGELEVRVNVQLVYGLELE